MVLLLMVMVVMVLNIYLLLAYKIKVGNPLVYDDEDGAATHGDGDDGDYEHLPALGLQDPSGQ